jgi:hypothetical protein
LPSFADDYILIPRSGIHVFRTSPSPRTVLPDPIRFSSWLPSYAILASTSKEDTKQIEQTSIINQRRIMVLDRLIVTG